MKKDSGLKIKKRAFMFYLDYGKIGCFTEIGITKEQYGEYLIDKYYKTDKKIKLKKLCINHEHREASDTNKNIVCHFQSFASFTNSIGINKREDFNFKINGEEFNAWVNSSLFDAEGAEDYCKKLKTAQDEHFFWENTKEEKENKSDFHVEVAEKTSDLFRGLLNNEITSENDLMETVLDTGNIYLMNSVYLHSDKYLYKKRITPVINNGYGWKHEWVPSQIQKWFDLEFSKPAGSRRKALIVLGERFTGKTFFFTQVIMKNPGGKDDPESNPSIVYFRGELDVRKFKNKPEASLIIMDDMDFKKSSTETYKALFSSQSCQLNTKYGLGVTAPLPLVYLTNNIDHFLSLFADKNFTSFCYFYWVGYSDANGKREFLCPPDIAIEMEKEKDTLEINFNVTDERVQMHVELRNAMEEEKKEKWKKILNKK